MSRVFLLASVLLMMFAAAATGQTGKKRMDEHLNLYQWIRSGASIAVCHITQLEQETEGNGLQSITIHLVRQEVLWGNPKAESTFTFETAENEIGRLKRPHRVWGRITLAVGGRILLVAGEEPLYANDIADTKDPALASLRAIVQAEKNASGDTARYLRWLKSPNMVELLFAAEALAREGDGDSVWHALAEAFRTPSDLFVKMSIGGLLWENAFPRASDLGKAGILAGTLQEVSNPQAALRAFAIDRVLATAPEVIQRLGVRAGVRELQAIRERADAETSPDVRIQMHRVLKALAADR